MKKRLSLPLLSLALICSCYPNNASTDSDVHEPAGNKTIEDQSSNTDKTTNKDNQPITDTDTPSKPEDKEDETKPGDNPSQDPIVPSDGDKDPESGDDSQGGGDNPGEGSEVDPGTGDDVDPGSGDEPGTGGGDNPGSGDEPGTGGGDNPGTDPVEPQEPEEPPVTIYKVYWYSGSTLLFTDDFEEGSTPTYDHNEPTRDTANHLVYTFIGWNTDPDANVKLDTLPTVTKDLTFYAVFSSSREEATTVNSTFTIDKTEIELDAGLTRTYKKASDSLQGDLTAAFNSSEQITCNYSSGHGYHADELKVKWSIDSSDTDYFTCSSDTDSVSGNSGTSTVTITAKKESRLSTVTVSLVPKDNESNVLQSKTCELRSVMTNAYWIGNQSRSNNYIGGESISSEYGTGYTARLYNKVYTNDLDIVFPSKLKVDGTTKDLVRIVGLSKSDGTGGPSASSGHFIVCRKIFIPNTVYMLSAGSVLLINPVDQVVFRKSRANVLFVPSATLYWNFRYNGTLVAKLYTQINSGIDCEFQYNKYSVGNTEASTSPGSYTNMSKLTNTILEKNHENSLLFKYA